MEDNRFEEEMFEKIRKSAENIEPPHNLEADHMIDLLNEKEQIPDKSILTRGKIFRLGSLAAAMLVVVAGIFATRSYLENKNNQRMMESASTESAMTTESSMDMESSEADDENAAYAESSAEAAQADSALAHGLTVASGYEEIYQRLADLKGSYMTYEDAATTDATTGSAESADEKAREAEPELADSMESQAGTDYSETNIQTEGVAEADIVKTDGKYIYVYNLQEGVKIIKAQKGQMELTGTIEDIVKSQSDDIADMYVSGDQLVLIVNTYKTSLENEQEDTYFLNNQQEVQVYTYDITDRKNPKQAGVVTMSGYYRSSRLVDGFLYLYTENSPVSLNARDGEETYEDYQKENDVTDLVPKINGESMLIDDIYLPETLENSTYLMLASIDLSNPEQVVDSKAILSMPDIFYVSEQAIYVTVNQWTGTQNLTDIVKIAYKNGTFTPQAAGNIEGSINNNFSLDEEQGYLRVVATNTDTLTTGVYIFDENMELTGSVQGIAPGENVKSVRFNGDIGYLVTYEQTDPLFAVDLSEPSNPTLLGQLKITGFSEYLHFYDDSRLLGLGWETDPDTQEVLGLKLSMYDISDPQNIKVENSLVVKNINQVTALFNYKGLLVDPKKNLIGFQSDTWTTEDSQSNYVLFAYDEEDGFKSLLTTPLKLESYEEPYYNWSNVRGIYIEDYFYVVDFNRIISYNMKENYTETAVFQ